MTGPVVQLWRFPEFASTTFGLLIAPGDWRRATIELPWRDNAPNVSCIPTGDHQAFWAWSPRHGRAVYHVAAEGRAGVEVDVANWSSELRGCLAMGRKIAKFPGKGWGITNSRSSRRAFHQLMGRRPFVLRIREASSV